MVRNWLDLPSHQNWLQHHTEMLLRFGRATPYPGGGAAWLTDAGEPWLDKGVHTWITGRSVHVYSLGSLLGIPGCRPVAAAALAGLTGPLRDRESGGWFSQINADGSTPDEKAAYAHAFVILAASSASLAGLDGARELLSEALAVFETRFWDEDRGRCIDTWNRDFTQLDPYRGINANMHAVEAFLAAADATGERLWLHRAARIASFAAAAAAANQWRLPEHFDADWNVQLELNAERPDDPFKPYGATVGHGLEWARLLLHLEAAGAEGTDWLGAARELYRRAVTDGWHADGADGFVYTTDWNGAPVVRDRMHWVAAEAIGAAAALFQRTAQTAYADDYARYWDYVEQNLLDRRHGSWHHQLDPHNRPVATVWPGKADLYHALQATLIPRLPLAPSMAAALAAGAL